MSSSGEDIVEKSKSKTEVFTETELTQREHMDPDIHWIGETLPAGSTSEMAYSGIGDAAGTSAFPARIDHSHDTYTSFSTYYHGNHHLVPTQLRYLDVWTFNYGKDILYPSSNQLFVFPREGLWDINLHLQIADAGGGAFSTDGYFSVRFDFDNITFIPNVLTQGIRSTAGYFISTINYHRTYTGSMIGPTTSNLQILISNQTAYNVYVSSGLLQITRLCSSEVNPTG